MDVPLGCHCSRSARVYWQSDYLRMQSASSIGYWCSQQENTLHATRACVCVSVLGRKRAGEKGSSWFQSVMSPITSDHVTVIWLLEWLSLSSVICSVNDSALPRIELLGSDLLKCSFSVSWPDLLFYIVTCAWTLNWLHFYVHLTFSESLIPFFSSYVIYVSLRIHSFIFYFRVSRLLIYLSGKKNIMYM